MAYDAGREATESQPSLFVAVFVAVRGSGQSKTLKLLLFDCIIKNESLIHLVSLALYNAAGSPLRHLACRRTPNLPDQYLSPPSGVTGNGSSSVSKLI
jgi:hypothetical protein